MYQSFIPSRPVPQHIRDEWTGAAWRKHRAAFKAWLAEQAKRQA